MPSFRKPKGVIARFIPDFNGRAMAGGGTFNSGTNGNYATCGLFNDSQPAADLVVWWAHTREVPGSPIPAGFGLTQVAIITGNAGQSLQPGVPLVTDQGQLPGSTWAGVIPVLNFNIILEIDCGTVPWEWQQPYPLCVLTPGFSLIFVTNDVAVTQNTSFIWEVSPAI